MSIFTNIVIYSYQQNRPLSFSSSKQEIIEYHVKNYNDVLLGRGGNNNKYPGNEQLRTFARSEARQYSRSGKLHKSKLSRTLVTRVRQLDPPGRFLKQDQNTKEWVDVGDITAREKASQVLRDAASALPPDYYLCDTRSSLSPKANCTRSSSQTFKDPRSRTKRADNQISTKPYYAEQLCQNAGNASIIAAGSATVLNAKNNINPSLPGPGHYRQKGSYYAEHLCQNGNHTSIIASSATVLNTNNINPSLLASGHNRLKRRPTSRAFLSDYHQKEQREDSASPFIAWTYSPTRSTRFSSPNLKGSPFDGRQNLKTSASSSIGDSNYNDSDSPHHWLPCLESFDDISRWGDTS